ncbi:MAG: adenine phosphoribosyltransferase [Mariprofundales bacterium]|nr:adenine phosphoribosyltransferase [Mariprofundales bacterium]
MTISTAIDFATYIRTVPDFPQPGIMFKDITPLLANPDAFSAAISQMSCFVPHNTTAILGIESRGFIFGAALAQQMDLSFVPVRKPGKLPAATYGIDYELEYGKDRLEIHQDALDAGQKVVIVDDLLATGGTAAATVELLRQIKGVDIGALLFAIELDFLAGRDKLSGIPVHSLLHYS